MTDTSRRPISMRQDPLTSAERLLIASCAIASIEGMISHPPRASIVLALEAVLPHLRPDPDFGRLAAAVSALLDALDGQGHLHGTVSVAKARVDDALLALLQRDFAYAAAEFQKARTGVAR